MSETHSKLSPSKAHRYLNCPVSVLRAQKYPETTSVYAEEGRLAHELAAAVLTDKPLPKGIPDDMHAPVKEYIDAVLSISQGATVVRVEEPLSLSGILGEDEKGTADYFAIVGDELQVHDLKYGKGERVGAKDNEQLMLYGLGALEIAEFICDIERVRLVIHQPRRGNMSEAVYTVEELRDWGQRAKSMAEVIRGMSIDDPANPGEKQCRWCPAKADCPELAAVCRATVNEFDDADQAERGVCIIGMEQLANSFALLNMIKSWISAVEETAMARMLQGAKMPGFKLVEGRAGSRQWTDDEEAEAKLKSMKLKVDEMYTKKVISPTAAEKLLAKSLPNKWEKLQSLITRTPPKPAIVPEPDRRPEMALAGAANVNGLHLFLFLTLGLSLYYIALWVVILFNASKESK